MRTFLKKETISARGNWASLNRNYVGMIEREENAPTVDALEQLSDALSVDPISFFQSD